MTDRFREDGILALRGFVPANLIRPAREAVVCELNRLKITSGGKISSRTLSGLPVFQQTVRLSGMVKAGPAIDRAISAEVNAEAERLAGRKLTPAGRPQLLLSLPSSKPWSLRESNWHTDIEVPSEDRTTGVQAFVLLDEVRPRGGATLALAGSHRLAYTGRGSALSVLRGSREFSETPELFIEGREVNGVPLRIVEMSGRAGDLFLMDLRVLHSPSVNCVRAVRMMVTERFLA